ncbi:MAG: hypothetical protein JW982_02305, partial [Spirochaetes bacterium]|nr:hypothetical protein [Spirochaetota bacterium]
GEKMKKITIAALSLIVILNLASCDWFSDDSSDEDQIKAVIENLEDAINAKNYNDFMDCFHSDCAYKLAASYSENPDFVGDVFYNETYNFTNYSISVNGSSANVSCTAIIVALPSEPTTFQMKKDDGSWKIFVWKEGDPSTTIFENIKPAE